MLTDIAIGIVFARQEQKAHRPAFIQMGQSGLQCPPRCTSPSGVAIKAENNELSEAKQLGHMLRRAGCAERRNGLPDAVLRQRDDIHVPLNHQGVSLLANGCSGLKKAV